MADRAHGDAQAHAPQHPRESADREEKGGEGKLDEPPVTVHEPHKGVVRDVGLDAQTRRAVEVEAAEELPRNIAQKAEAVREIIVALRQALRPVARVVNADDGRWPAHADEDAKKNERAAQGLSRAKSAVDHEAVHPDAVAEQQREISQSEKERDR